LTGEAYLAIGDMYRRNKQNEQAMAVYLHVVTEFAGTPFEGQGKLLIGHTHRRLNEFDKALAIYNEVMTKYKGGAFEQEGEIYRAIAYRDMGDTTQAVSAFVSFLEHWPKSEDAEYANEQIKKLRGE
jgi:TolA-binding protein